MKSPAFLLLVCLMGYAAAGSATTSVQPASAARRALAGRELMASKKDPPSSQTGSNINEGFVFSFIVPNYTPVSFNGDKQAALCAEIAAVTGLPAKATMQCSVETVSSFNGTSIIASGMAFANWTRHPTAGDVSDLATVRDAWVQTLTASPATVFTTFPGTVPNCACAGLESVTKPSTSSYSYTTTVLPLGPVQCDARLTYPSDVPTSQVGVDNGSVDPANLGKFCSTPPVQGGVLGTPGVGSCVEYGVVAAPPGWPSGTQAQVDPSKIRVQDGGVVFLEPTFLDNGFGYTEAPVVTISAPNPTPVTFTWNLDNNGSPQPNGHGNLDLNPETGLPRNGPYAAGTTVTLTDLEDVCVDMGAPDWYTNEQIYACTGPTKTFTFNELTFTGPVCTAEDFNQGRGSSCSGIPGGNGNPGDCVTMDMGSSDQNNFVWMVQFPGFNPRCSKPPQTVVSADNLQAAVAAEVTAEINAGGQVINLVVTKPGSGYRWLPKVTIAPPSFSPPHNFGKMCSANPVPGLDLSIAVSIPIAEGVTLGGQCQPIGRDTYLNKPCSIPSVAGGVWAPLNSFTCNVESSFRTQPTEPKALSACAVLAQRCVPIGAAVTGTPTYPTCPK